MNTEKNGALFFLEIFRGFLFYFAITILAMSIAGIMVAHFYPEAKNESTLFALGKAGMPYSTILQLAGFSLILAVVSVLLLSEYFFVKMRFLHRVLFLILSALLVSLVFSVIFKWFPVNSLQAWLRFVLSTFISFAVSSCLTLIKFKLEGKKYNKLLANYKAMRKDNISNNSHSLNEGNF